jgi:hypothetical protein
MAAGALRKVIVLPGDVRRDESCCLAARGRQGQNVAGRAAEVSLARIEAEIQIMPELAQLIVEGIARDQGMAPARHFALREIPVASQEQSALALRTFDQEIVRDGLVVCGVIPQHAKLPGDPAQHGIGKKDPRGCGMSRHHLSASYCPRCSAGLESTNPRPPDTLI